MRIGMGVLRWSPSEFWHCTVPELYSALEGWQDAHGIERKHPGMTPDELRTMMDKFPDISDGPAKKGKKP
jgi:hypothetical protein